MRSSLNYQATPEEFEEASEQECITYIESRVQGAHLALGVANRSLAELGLIGVGKNAAAAPYFHALDRIRELARQPDAHSAKRFAVMHDSFMKEVDAMDFRANEEHRRRQFELQGMTYRQNLSDAKEEMKRCENAFKRLSELHPRSVDTDGPRGKLESLLG